MKVSALIWPEDRIEHIGRHNIIPEEFEEVCFGRSLVFRVGSFGPNPVYNVLGQTESGDYLLCVVIAMPHGAGYPVTARLMTRSELRRYLGWRK